MSKLNEINELNDRKQKQAIATRVSEILLHSKNVDQFTIKVFGAKGEVTEINYSIKEYILPETVILSEANQNE